MLTPLGNLSSKINPGRTWQRHLKIERIVRLTAAGYSDTEIAFALRITAVYVSMLRRTPEYAAIRAEVNTGVISDEDTALREDIANVRAELRDMVPAALLSFRDAIYDKSNPKLRFEAAKEILDREGTVAKVSRSEIKVKDELDYSKHDSIATDLLAALQASTNTTLSDDINDSVAEFISTAVNEDAQEKIHARLDLENLDTKTATLQ